MFIQARKLIGLPIAAVDASSKVGEIANIVIDPANGQLLGFLIKVGGLFSPAMALSIVDVREWDPNGLVTSLIDNLINPNEIVRIKTVVDNKIDLLKMSAKTESGKSLGQVEDLLINTDTTSVAKYYLKDLLGNSRVLPADKVIKIDKHIIFADDVGELGGGVVGAAV